MQLLKPRKDTTYVMWEYYNILPSPQKYYENDEAVRDLCVCRCSLHSEFSPHQPSPISYSRTDCVFARRCKTCLPSCCGAHCFELWERRHSSTDPHSSGLQSLDGKRTESRWWENVRVRGPKIGFWKVISILGGNYSLTAVKQKARCLVINWGLS